MPSNGNGPVLTALSPAAAGTAALVSLQGWERPGAGEARAALSREYVTLSPSQHPGCVEVAPNQKTVPMSPQGRVAVLAERPEPASVPVRGCCGQQTPAILPSTVPLALAQPRGRRP